MIGYVLEKKITFGVNLEVTLESKLIRNGKFFGGAIAAVQEERGYQIYCPSAYLPNLY